MPEEREIHKGPFIFSTDPDLTQKPSVGTKWYSPAQIQARDIISYERPKDKMALDIRIDRGAISVLGSLILCVYAVLVGCVAFVFADSIMRAYWWLAFWSGLSLIFLVDAFYVILSAFVRAAIEVTFNSVRSAITKLKPILDKVPITEYVGCFPCEEGRDSILKN